MTDSVISFLKSADFSKGLVLALAILIVLGISYVMGVIGIGMSLVLGMFISAPANYPGSNRHRVNGMLVAIFLGIVNTIIINLVANQLFLFIPVMAGLIFLTSYLSVFGFRASLVSFSGLLAIMLSLAHPREGIEIFTHAGWIGLGGLWYLLFSLLVHRITQKSHTLQMMSGCMDLTATYLKTGGELALKDGEKQALQKQLFELQTTLNTKHEALREILLGARKNAGQSNFFRRQVLILIELIDILELAIGNLPHIFRMQERFNSSSEQLQPFVDLIFTMADHLRYLSLMIGSNRPLKEDSRTEHLLQAARKQLEEFKTEAHTPISYEEVLLLKNIYDYLQKQAQKMEVIQKVILNLVEQDQLWSRNKDSGKFITTQDYDWKTFTDNLNFNSPIFKHSLRLTLTVLVGYVVGLIFPFQNAYWILLTIVVIMRPGYTLTQQRSKHRLYGTLIGGAIAVVVVFITQNDYIYGIFAVLTFIMGFSLVQKNYKSSAIFITLNIVFIYALLKTDPLDAIQFRVLDTLTGAALAFIANSFFWPSWQFLNIGEFVTDSIRANGSFLMEINKIYQQKTTTGPSYKLNRKKAFLAIGNLNAAFQRMTQEPKQQQRDLAKIYEVVVLNNTFLSLTASLGTYIRHQQTTAASTHFKNYIDLIYHNLEKATATLEETSVRDILASPPVQEAQEYLDQQYERLVSESALSEDNTDRSIISRQLQEIKLISDQLKWLLTISENLQKTLHGLS